ncbi:hypothetical protein KUTeg_005132 [Tegillarca granosa]|uniref:Equilibrative nucleoside transporter 1 n=1 Tax=Tegillarca granosa TaxID=220873 RepID=A0ABQ9FIW2_TEGGR|nr:hypothetical protein KUTeg_005132 [Tegillarca granosa]
MPGCCCVMFLRFYRFYRDRAENDDGPPQQESCGRSFVQTCKRFGTVFSKIWVQAVSVWFVFFVSLTCFPGLWSQVKKINIGVHDDYFAPVFCFLSFNLMAFLGNLTSEVIKKPGPRFVWIPILLRGLFIPFFVLCNYKPATRIFPVIISNDYVFIIGSAFMAYTSGYYSSLNMMYGPKLVEPEMAGTAGMIMAFCLVLGIGTGVNFSLAVGKAVSPI